MTSKAKYNLKDLEHDLITHDAGDIAAVIRQIRMLYDHTHTAPYRQQLDEYIELARQHVIHKVRLKANSLMLVKAVEEVEERMQRSFRLIQDSIPD